MPAVLYEVVVDVIQTQFIALFRSNDLLMLMCIAIRAGKMFQR